MPTQATGEDIFQIYPLTHRHADLRVINPKAMPQDGCPHVHRHVRDGPIECLPPALKLFNPGPPAASE